MGMITQMLGVGFPDPMARVHGHAPLRIENDDCGFSVASAPLDDRDNRDVAWRPLPERSRRELVDGKDNNPAISRKHNEINALRSQ